MKEVIPFFLDDDLTTAHGPGARASAARASLHQHSDPKQALRSERKSDSP